MQRCVLNFLDTKCYLLLRKYVRINRMKSGISFINSDANYLNPVLKMILSAKENKNTHAITSNSIKPV